MKHKYTTFEKFGWTLLITGSLAALIPILVRCFMADIVLGTIILGLATAVLGALMLLR